MNSFYFHSHVTLPNIVHEYKASVKSDCIPIVIDNGSFHCRAGWASSNAPELDFKNVIAKNRGNRKDKDWDVLVADEIPDIESVRWLLRTPYDFNIAVNFSYQETLLDYAFEHLGIDSEGEIQHPLLITEPIANPSFCRKNMTELLFEAYNIPKLKIGIDCLFSRYFNLIQCLPKTALVISSGFQSTHIFAVIDGSPDIRNALRLNLGGHNCAAYMQRLLQLKNPHFASELNLSRMEQVIQNLCYIPSCYMDEIRKWANPVHQVANNTKLLLPVQENAKSNSFQDNAVDKTLQFNKELVRTQHKLAEVSAVLELANESPDIALKAAKDMNCNDVDQLKHNFDNIQSEISKLQSQLTERKSNLNSKHFADCGIEKIQVPEILFQPTLVGYEQCGIKECVQIILHRYSPENQVELAKNVFLTGGTTNIEGFTQRIFADLQELCPYKSEINVKQATDPSLDAWKGAALWAMIESNSWFTRHDFDEYGPEYFKKHRFSN